MSDGEPSSIKQYVPCDIVNSFGCMLNYMQAKKYQPLSEVEKLYQALYRKWRPKIFNDVIGQNHITKTLKSEVMSGRISHAYLFTGSRGTGKTSCAKILAKAVNCLESESNSPCLKCDICKGIESETILDIVEIDAASNNGVENIRSMREEVVFSPARCRYRVYIVDEVHMLSTGAFNAFLKVLEEPPPHVIFILATTEIHKLPATIISRCQRFDFHRITSEDILKRIKYICEQENIKTDDGAAKIIADSADGAMRDALSILDQCSSACQNSMNEESVKKMLGITDTECVSGFVKLIFSNRPAECLELIDEMHRESKNMLRLCEEMMEYYKNFMIYKVTGDTPVSEHEKMYLNKTSLEDILFALDTLQNSYKNMSSGTNKKLEMEIAAVKLCDKFNDLSEHVKIPELRTEDEQKKSQPPKKTAEIIPKKDKPADHSDTKTLLHPSGDKPIEFWARVLEELKNNKSLKSLYISLRESSAYKRENHILIDSSNSLAFELLRRDEYKAAIKKIIKNVTGRHYNLGPYSAEEKNSDDTAEIDPFETLIKNADNNGINIKLI